MSENSLQFAAHLSDIGSYACVAHGIAMGSNLGLFEVLAGLDKPATCEEVAKAAGYRERYVREWLALMVTGKIIDYDVIAKTYYISKHKMPFLTSSGKDLNKAFLMQEVDIVTKVSKQLEAGIVWVNTWLNRDLRTPFGGVKNSGVGREGGFEALRFFQKVPVAQFRPRLRGWSCRPYPRYRNPWWRGLS